MSTNSIDFKEFSRKFKFIENLGRGGGGRIIHVYDELMDAHFAIKKYEPHDNNKDILSYDKFLEEIRLLYHIDHPNIVRIYNYYEYPNSNVAYIQMEYVEGRPITECIYDTSLDWNQIFQATVNAFRYLEENGILHRDIRPANILIDNSGNVKIIDFGFGKKVSNGNDGTNQNSVCLNWEAPLPNEVRTKNKYNHATEIYFLGWLFKNVTEHTEDFKYNNIIEKMIQDNEKKRYKSFFEILLACFDIFTEEEKEIYQKFANKLDECVNHHLNQCVVYDIESVEQHLYKLLQNVALEDKIQMNELVISCIIKNRYNYKTNVNIPVSYVKKFYDLFSSSSHNKKQIILNSLNIRLLKKQVKKEMEEVPF